MQRDILSTPCPPRQAVTKWGSAAEQMKIREVFSISFFINVLLAKSICNICWTFVAIQVQGGNMKSIQMLPVAELLLSLNGSLGAWSSSLNLQCSAQLNKEVPGTPSFCHSECGSVGLPPGL